MERERESETKKVAQVWLSPSRASRLPKKEKKGKSSVIMGRVQVDAEGIRINVGLLNEGQLQVAERQEEIEAVAAELGPFLCHSLGNILHS